MGSLVVCLGVGTCNRLSSMDCTFTESPLCHGLEACVAENDDGVEE